MLSADTRSGCMMSRAYTKDAYSIYSAVKRFRACHYTVLSRTNGKNGDVVFYYGSENSANINPNNHNKGKKLAREEFGEEAPERTG